MEGEEETVEVSYPLDAKHRSSQVIGHVSRSLSHQGFTSSTNANSRRKQRVTEYPVPRPDTHHAEMEGVPPLCLPVTNIGPRVIVNTQIDLDTAGFGPLNGLSPRF
ncbi:hypothetical protein RRG08_057730 [Elysia crispata]|uniref:Uncharacterized protein n=1 Tax=Elysia crispata TaxID=231223 RepID=A0AAE0Y8J9_9GAST|nr:hypothetical protein RRG08_057730 [Elysia crispata]